MKVKRLPERIGRCVKWNAVDDAEIVSAWVVMVPQKAGVTTVGYESETWALFRLPNGQLVDSELGGKTLLPEE